MLNRLSRGWECSIGAQNRASNRLLSHCRIPVRVIGKGQAHPNLLAVIWIPRSSTEQREASPPPK